MEVHDFFLMLAIILISARLFSEASQRVGIPSVIGELVAGVLLGPSLLGWVQPDETMKLMAEIGIILLLFEVGMDTDVFRLAQTGPRPWMVALGGVALPFAGGYWVSHQWFDLSLLASLFIAGTLTATSIGITVRVLGDLGRRHSEEAQIVLGAAVLDDIIGVILLAFLYDFSIKGELNWTETANVALFIVLFMVIGPFVAKFVASVIDRTDQSSSTPGMLITMVLSLILVMSWLAHVLGAAVIMGGFAAGIALGQTFRARLAQSLRIPFTPQINKLLSPSPDLAHRLEEKMRPLIHTFTPVFFVMVGVSLNLREVDWGSSTVWALGGSLLFAGFLGKFLSGYLIRGEPGWVKAAIGLCMIPRGEVGLIFAQLGYGSGILDAEKYAALLIVIALTTLMPPFLLKAFYTRYGHDS
ncbi:MAG: cation:proton antiporter [Thiobacillaceae bacterium]